MEVGTVENPYLDLQVENKRDRHTGNGSSLLKPQSTPFFNKAIPPNSSQEVPPTEDKVVKYKSMGTLLVQTPQIQIFCHTNRKEIRTHSLVPQHPYQVGKEATVTHLF